MEAHDGFYVQPENDFEKITSKVNQAGDNLLGDLDDFVEKTAGGGVQPVPASPPPLIQPLPEAQQDEEVSTTTETPGAACTWFKGVDPRVVDLIYWRDVKKTGVVFGTMLTVLLSLAIFSLVSVVAYLSLALLTVCFSFVVYKKIMGAVQKSGDAHPFKCVLDMDITLKEEKLKTVIDTLLKNINKTSHELRRLFLIEDLVDSVKFGILLWVATYVGSMFNGITLVIIAVILLFTVPKVYETYQVQIDQQVDLLKGHLNNVISMIQAKVPFLKKKEKPQ